MSKIKEDVMEKFFEFIDRLKGRKDVKSRVEVIANPENLKTMSILSRGQVEFCAVAGWASSVPEWGGLFTGLNDYAEELKAHSISFKGMGREQAIRFMASLSETKLLSKLAMNITGEPREGKGKK